MATATIFDFLLNQQRGVTSSLVGGSVTFYSAGTNGLKTVWTDSIASTEAPNPYTLDARAAAVVYGIGNYKIVLRDAEGSVVATWDNVFAGADLSSIDLSGIIAAASFSNRDFIGNSRFNIWNSGTSFAISSTTDTVTADGWYYRSNGSGAGTVDITREDFAYGQTEVEGNPLYYSKIHRTSASTGATSETYAFRLPIETASGEEMTFRFNAVAATAADVTVVCVQNFGSGGSATVTTTSTAITLTTSWARYFKTFTVPSIAGKTVGSGAYVEVGISFAPNTTYEIGFAQCKFETGTVASADEPRTSYEDDIRTSGTIATRADITIADTAGAMDEKYWRMSMDRTANTLTLAALDDAQSGGGNVLVANRTGSVIDEVTLYNSAKSVTVTDAADTIAEVIAARGASGSLSAALVLKAPVASPTFTGIPAGPTAAADTDTTQLATTAFAKKEADDAQAFSIQRANHTGTQAQATIVNLVSDLAAKAPLLSPALTGVPTAPTAATSENSTQIATTEFVQNVAMNTALPEQSAGTTGQQLYSDGADAYWDDPSTPDLSSYATLTTTQTLENKTLTSPVVNGGSVNDANINGPIYTRDDDGTISAGTWAIDYANGPVIKATAGANITSITMSNWPASGTGGHLRLMLVNFGAYTITFPSAWKWIKADLTLTTTFADLGLTLPSSGTCLVDLFSDDGGTTIYASVVRG